MAILASVVAVGAGAGGIGLFSLALLAEGISRFIGSGLSAALPHGVKPSAVVSANAVAATLGSAIAVGARSGCERCSGPGMSGRRRLRRSRRQGRCGRRFSRIGSPRERWGRLLLMSRPIRWWRLRGGLLTELGMRGGRLGSRLGLWRCSRTGRRMGFRCCSVLLMRNYFADDGIFRAGLPGLGQLVACAGAGILVAGLVTARLIRSVGRTRAVLASLLVSAVAQAALGLPMLLPLALIASFLIVGTGQVVKLSVDSSVQLDVADEARGRVFALYERCSTSPRWWRSRSRRSSSRTTSTRLSSWWSRPRSICWAGPDICWPADVPAIRCRKPLNPNGGVTHRLALG
ncbi:hypothetical protein A4R44_01887 [Amycolatopsis sp. M39]|nr:hypothetical protein A4R44_01887 [Amycolatopsis sp. M39]